MTKVATTKDAHPRGRRRGPTSQLTLNGAYRAVFKNIGKDANTDLVLADLAEHSAYYAILPEDATDAQLRQHNGMRKVFSRILSLLDVSSEERDALRIAAIDEMQVSAEEGIR